MEDFPEKLKEIAQSKYFAIIAFFFFLCIAVFILILLSSQNNSHASIEELRNKIELPPHSRNSDSSQRQEPLSITPMAVETEIEKDTKEQVPKSIIQRSSSEYLSYDLTPEEIENHNRIVDTANPLPRISYNGIVIQTALPSVPKRVAVSRIKNTYSPEEITELARTLGVNTSAVKQTSRHITYFDDEHGSFLSTNLNSGEFVYVSDIGLPIPTNYTDLFQKAKYINTKIGHTHPCIAPYATYERESEKNVDFVESHCMWEKTDHPQLNAYGLLTNSGAQKASTATIGIDPQTAEPDPDIVRASDIPGYARPNDFNAVTVAFDRESGNAVLIASNIRKVLDTFYTDVSAVRTPAQAIDLMRSGRYSLTLTTPIGNGHIDFPTVYAGDTTSTVETRIEDITLAFNTTPGLTAPAYSCAQYFISGTTTFESGYRGRFITLVPALEDPRCSQVLGTHTEYFAQTAELSASVAPTGGLQYGTFQFRNTPPPQPTIIPQIEMGQIQTGNCPPGVNHAWRINECEAMVWIDRSRGKTLISREWYWYVKPDCLNTSAFANVEDVFHNKQKNIRSLRSELISKCTWSSSSSCPIDASLGTIAMGHCQLVTKASPHIYLYPLSTKTADLSVTVGTDIVYADPPLTDTNLVRWEIRADSEGNILTEDGHTATSLFYEYDARLVNLLAEQTDMTKGIRVHRNNLERFATQIGIALRLNKQETRDFLLELLRESKKVEGDNIDIHLLSPKVLDSFIPLHISKETYSRYRVHFLLTTGSSSILTPFTLSPLSREGLTIIEIGVATM